MLYIPYGLFRNLSSAIQCQLSFITIIVVKGSFYKLLITLINIPLNQNYRIGKHLSDTLCI